MSKASPESATLKARAAVFAALGDETRLGVFVRLSTGEARSIAELTRGTALTRQAVTKHLRVLEGAGLVKALRTGRESRYTLEPGPVEELRSYLDEVSHLWDQALHRLKSFIEDAPH